MKKKSIWIITSVLLVTALVAGSVYAFYKGNIDGVWGEIDQLQYIDIIGKIGEDPGTEWGTDLTSTADNTLIRNPNICQGDIHGTDAFDPALQWTGYADQTYTGLGTHTATCNGNGLIISQYVETSTGRQIIEIYNTAAFPISLLGYKLQIFAGGSATATTTIDLSTSVILAGGDIDADPPVPGGVWVVSDANYGDITEDQLAPALAFSGDDVVALVRGGNGVQDYEDAECSNWATGPTGTNPDADPTTWYDYHWNQSPETDDWNQVRYGRPGYTGSPYRECSDIDDAGFLLQSGFGFNGIDIEDPLVYYGKDQPFVMGVLCHYNNPIYSQSSEGKLQSVPLTVTVGDIKCDDVNQTPAVPSSASFTYNLRLDETSNTGVALEDCPYPSMVPCSDGVFISQPPSAEVFACEYTGGQVITYTVVVLGFMEENADGTCPAWNAADAKRDFISEEGDTNCACMYGMIADEVPQAVELLYFSAEALEGAISLEWATATETDNFGFNLYRATALDGEQTQLNGGLIPSLVAPGSPYGAEYNFVDETAEPGVLYYYWLEDVDLSMITTLHGPVEAIIE